MKKNRTLLYYMSHNNDNLLPPDSMVINIASSEWFTSLKPHFNDLIWQYYSSRVVFIDDRFLIDDDDAVIISNIIKSFAILLKTKAYEFEKLYDTTLLDYNPIWNVDGVTGTIHEQAYNEVSNQIKSGSDTTIHTGSDTLHKRGYDILEKRGNDNTEFERDTQEYVNTYDSIDYDPPAEFPSGHTHEKDDKNKITYNSDDKQNYLSDYETEYDSSEELEYDSAVDGTGEHFQQDLDLSIRQGNIGVTTTQKMITEEREVALFDFYKTVVHECVNTCTYAID